MSGRGLGRGRGRGRGDGKSKNVTLTPELAAKLKGEDNVVVVVLITRAVSTSKATCHRNVIRVIREQCTRLG